MQVQMGLWDSRTWQACVLSIWDTQAISDVRPYAFLVSACKSVKKWFLCAEKDSNEQIHVHLLALTHQRSDSFKRTLENTWGQVAIAAMSDIEQPDPTLEIVKCQKCHKPSSLLAYMAKDPEWIAAENEEDLMVFNTAWSYDLGLRFRQKQELEKAKKADPNTAQMHAITAEITEVITNHNCRSVEDCMRAAPEIIAKHLHRSGIATIIQNCIAWVTSTGAGWSLVTINLKHTPDPTAIHTTLLHQGIVPDIFDRDFYTWISKSDLKKNSFVLWGPTNTGKSAFLSGLKLCINWGEIVNSNTFAFEGLINNQIGIWEEPLISPELAEKAKQIFEGMETSIPVKYRKPVKLPRTPIFITTNHAPWRFCTKEEEMFRNRMFIYSWENNMHDTTFHCRTSEHRCKCRVCQESRGSAIAAGGESTGCLSGGEQPVQQLVPTTSQTGNVSTGSLPGSGEGEIYAGTETERERGAGTNEGSHSRQCSSDTGRQQVKCTHSTGLSSSTSTTASHSLRPDREPRSCDTGERANSPELWCAESLGSDGSGHDHDRNRGHNRDGDTTDTDSEPDTRYSRRPIQKRRHSEEMVLMGENQNKKARHQIPTTERRLGGEMGTLTIPTRSQWFMYLSYLQSQYG